MTTFTNALVCIGIIKPVLQSINFVSIVFINHWTMTEYSALLDKQKIKTGKIVAEC